MLAPLHSAIDRGEHESISSCYYMKIQNIHSWQCAPPGLISHNERACDYASFSVLSNILQKVLSKRITSAINENIKSSLKPWSGTTANHNLHMYSSGERNQEQRKTKVSFGSTTIWALELQRSVKRHIASRDKAMLNSEEIKPIALAVIELCLSEGISQSDSQLISRKIY